MQPSGFWSRTGLGLLQLALPVEIALSLDDPRRRGLVSEVVSEPLEDAALIVDLVGLFPQTVILAAIFQQNDILLCPARDVIQFHALMKEHRTVTIADFNQQRRRHVLHIEDG